MATPRARRTSAASNGNGGVTAAVEQEAQSLADKSGIPQELIDAIRAMGKSGNKKTIITDDDIQTHPGSAIIIPEGKPLEWAVDALNAKIREQEQEHTFTRFFNYRPEDGANAAANVLQAIFGIVVGKPTPNMFGPPTPPQYRTITVGVGKTRDVPWGEITIPALPGASVMLDATMGEMGPVFYIQVTAPKKHKKVIEALFQGVEAELKIASIYRGQAVEGTHELKFIDLAGFDPNRIVFSDQVQNTLDAAIYTVIQHPMGIKRAGMKLRRAILAYGPYGTGKSSLGLITAQLAVKHDWTFLSAKAGRDNLRDAFRTAALYERAVLFIEDIDAHTPRASNKDAVSEILDLFDGITAKDREILVVMTTNHVETVTAGLLRPGRIDYVVEISGLDRHATEKLIRSVVAADQLGNVNFDEVYGAMPDFQPAWVKAVADRAQSFALARTEGQASYRLTTEDLVGAAYSLHPQLELMRKAVEGHPEPELHTAFRAAIKDAVTGVKLVDSDGDSVRGWKLSKDAD